MSPTAPLGSESRLPAAWRLGRRPSPLPGDAESAGLVRLLIVGINPSRWTTAVNAPFARPGNRFWPSLAAAGILPRTVDASRALSPDDERLLAERGIGIADLVGRTTARAAQLIRAQLRAGGRRLIRRAAVVGITAFRQAFDRPGALLGGPWVPGWPDGVALWALPNASGLSAHETAATLAQKWREVWAATGAQPASLWG